MEPRRGRVARATVANFQRRWGPLKVGVGDVCREQKHGVYNIRELVNSHDYPPVPWRRPGGPGAAFSAVFWPRASPIIPLPHQRKTPLGGSDPSGSPTRPPRQLILSQKVCAVRQFAQRGDPPVAEWPGRVITREDLMAASGDKRDWFRYGHRLKAYDRAWREFIDARRRRRNFMAGFDWNQILILGEYGSGKTSLGIKIARHFFGLGHPVFSNSRCAPTSASRAGSGRSS